MTARIRLLAHIYIILCGGCIAIGIVICAGLLLSSRDPRSGQALEMIGGFFVSASAVYFVPGLVGGIGLLRGRHWARIVIIVLSVLGIFAIPVGTILGALGLWVLLGPDGQQLSAAVPPPPAKPATKQPVSPTEKKRFREVLTMAAGILAGFIVVIGTGYRITGDPGSPISSFSYFVAIGVLALVIAAIGRKIWRHIIGGSTPEERAALRDAHRQFVANRQRAEKERREQLERLSADPLRRKYADRIRRGESWSDDQIEYDLDSGRLATCEHLAPIEREMRAASITLRLLEPRTVSARCRIDLESFRERFALSPFVAYDEPQPNTSFFEAPLPAGIVCGEHASSMEVVHPLDADAETPVFPFTSGNDPRGLEDYLDRFTQLRGRLLPLARRIDVPASMLPTHRNSVGTGLPHIEMDDDSFDYVREDRGIRTVLLSTESMGELLYHVFRDITFSMGATEASNHQPPGEDYRRGAFREQLVLLRRLNPEWASRCAREQEEEAATRPFADR